MVIAANIEVDAGEQSAGDQQSMEQSIQIEQVTLPPQTPPEAPPDEVPPDFQEPPPAQEAPDPDAYAMATPVPAVPTPTPQPETTPIPAPTATPQPEATPSPAPTPSPGMTAEPSVAPSSAPSPTAAPSPTPTPDARFADLPPQFANLPESEKVAAKVLKKYLEDQNLEIPEELPFGFDSWEAYAKYINSDYEAEARRLGTLPDSTKGSDGGPVSGQTPDPNANGENGSSNSASNGSGNGSGDGNANGSGSGGGFKFRLPGVKKSPRFDENLNADDLKNPDLNGDLDRESSLFNNGSLDDLTKTRDLNFDSNLSVPRPTPIPLPPVETGDIGMLLYLRFEYDGQVFRAQWPAEDVGDKVVSVQYAPPNKPGLQKNFDMPWVAEFAADHRNIAQAALQIYERRKKQQR